MSIVGERMKLKSKAAKQAFVKGLLMGASVNHKDTVLDYGFGPRGLGLYVYKNDIILFFQQDEEND